MVLQDKRLRRKSFQECAQYNNIGKGSEVHGYLSDPQDHQPQLALHHIDWRVSPSFPHPAGHDGVYWGDVFQQSQEYPEELMWDGRVSLVVQCWVCLVEKMEVRELIYLIVLYIIGALTIMLHHY